jgi:hypothetical protein
MAEDQEKLELLEFELAKVAAVLRGTLRVTHVYGNPHDVSRVGGPRPGHLGLDMYTPKIILQVSDKPRLRLEIAATLQEA